MHHFRIASGVFHLLDELLAGIKGVCPIGGAALDVAEVVAEQDQSRNLCQCRNLRGRQSRTRHFDRDHPFDAGWIDERRLLRKEAGLGMAHQNRPTQPDSQRGHVLPCGVRRRKHRVEVRYHLLVKLLNRLDGKLPVRERCVEGRTESEHRPGCLMTGR